MALVKHGLRGGRHARNALSELRGARTGTRTGTERAAGDAAACTTAATAGTNHGRVAARTRERGGARTDGRMHQRRVKRRAFRSTFGGHAVAEALRGRLARRRRGNAEGGTCEFGGRRKRAENAQSA